MNPIPIMPARLDWPSAIGNFLLNFGTLEYFVFVFLKDHLPEDEFKKVREWHLKDRLARIVQHLSDENYSQSEQTTFASLIERLEPMRELRNHIAHGHMFVRIDEKSLKPTVTLFKAKDVDTGSLPDSRHVEFTELESALTTMSQLNQEFEQLAGFNFAGQAATEQDLRS